MTIDELVAAFAALPGARVGRGPHHPVTPHPVLALELNEFFEAYPGLSMDAGFVELLWKYGGLARANDDGTELFDVFGFGREVTEYHDLYGPAIDDEGFFIFAVAQEHDFAFHLTGGREPGVYVFESDKWTMYAEDFTTFLADAVKRGGVWAQSVGT